jgi:putative aminopeptidase FrvX
MFLPALGSTELGRIIAASGGLVDGTTLQIPTNGYHTMHEMAAISSCEAYIRLLRDAARL